MSRVPLVGDTPMERGEPEHAYVYRDRARRAAEEEDQRRTEEQTAHLRAQTREWRERQERFRREQAARLKRRQVV